MNRNLVYLAIGSVIGLLAAVPLRLLDEPIKKTQRYLWTLKNIETISENGIDSLRIDAVMNHSVYDDIETSYGVVEEYNKLSAYDKNQVDNFILPALHGEATGEPIESIIGVAYSILNRKKSDNFPNTFEGVITEIVKGKYQYSFYANPNKRLTPPITENYYAMLKIAIYMVKDKLDSLTSVPYLKTVKHRGRFVSYWVNRTFNIRLTRKIKNTFLYATHDAMLNDAWFSQYSKGLKRNQATIIKVGGHSFIVAKENSPLASLL